MTSNPASLWVLMLAGCTVCLGFSGVTPSALAQLAPSRGKAPTEAAGAAVSRANAPAVAARGIPDDEPRFEFDIPAQPLAAAIDRFAAISRQPVVFLDELVDGRLSAAIHRQYDALSALRIMLVGTGLAVDDVSGRQSSPGGVRAFVLSRVAGTTDDAAPLASAPSPLFDGLVQSGVWSALCNNPSTEPGGYRALLQFQVDGGGRIRYVRLLGSTGDRYRDAAIVATLTAIDVGQAPPPGLAQPLTLMIVPRDALSQWLTCQGGRRHG
ncbi:hypothetical protein [Pandoraea apista]|uniref:hypothetical protein n=1 Tax=Pandoraea apista TaxID=93218 RepID=UPI002F92B3DD